MTVAVQDHDATTVVTVVGAVDALTAPRLREALRHAFDELAGRVLVVDLTEVRFLGSPGLRALADSAREAVDHHGLRPLRIIVDHSRPVIRPIEIVGLDGVLDLYQDVEAALRDHG
ncbi:anti-sigma factor antagonist [Pseudonocardia broussonetiae]|uniref:Anti-sigma factor antagonist n=1 Tax=Pseudonocardia broussonetiae TaxID=2736640 RepID=A0A6M6JRE6_9PSEU|nr:anti-sigma factor antagonist [Pseudonocardia broussonetiae]QJY48969.1 anti-sigma factor antagonist [Pseudonocardia broussonetiae]